MLSENMQQDAEKVEQADEKQGHKWVNVERGLYKDENTGQYYERIRSGRNTWLSLQTTKVTEARERLDARRAVRAAQRLGLKVREPNKKPVTVGDVLDRFEKDGFPNKKGHKRKNLTQPNFAMRFLRKFFATMSVAELKQKLLDDYHEWRVKQVKRKKSSGDRTTDLDLQVLSVALAWAHRKDMIQSNPIERRARFTDAGSVRHAKDVAPEDMAAVQKMASKFFAKPNSEVLGWQMLYAAMTGQRTEEVLSLRSDAAPEEPGFRTKDGRTLYVRRVKNKERENPCVFVHDDLAKLLEDHAKWKEKRFPRCPWYFPGRDGVSVLSAGALAHALRNRNRAKRVTPHGLRAIYVKIRRSNGIADSQIAWEINHTSGTATLEAIYGGIPQHWRDGTGPKLSWTPGRPAWEAIQGWPYE